MSQSESMNPFPLSFYVSSNRNYTENKTEENHSSCITPDRQKKEVMKEMDKNRVGKARQKQRRRQNIENESRRRE